MMNKARFEFFFILLILFVFEMVVQTEGRWLCDGTDDSICKKSCMKLGRVGGNCVAFPSINGKLWYCICRN
ncbi:hypothetical protein P8452_19599 [Trifolium repens]|nr:hypothetical protein P8452_19599 [Trifolium repens]